MNHVYFAYNVCCALILLLCEWLDYSPSFYTLFALFVGLPMWFMFEIEERETSTRSEQ